MDQIRVTVVAIEGLTKQDLPEVFKLAAGEPAVVSKKVETTKVAMQAHTNGAAAPGEKAETKTEPPKEEKPAAAKAAAAPKKAEQPKAAGEKSNVTPIASGRSGTASGKGQQKLLGEGEEAEAEREPGADDEEGVEAAEGEEGPPVDLEGVPEEILRSVKHSDIVKHLHKQGHNQDQIVDACKRMKKEGLAPSIVKLVDVETRVRATCNAEGID